MSKRRCQLWERMIGRVEVYRFTVDYVICSSGANPQRCLFCTTFEYFGSPRVSGKLL